MKRRTFIAGLGGAAAWSVATRAQPTLPTVGYLSYAFPEQAPNEQATRNVLGGLREAGFTDGRNVAIEYRFTRHEFAGLAADLVRRQVAVIIAMTTPAAVAAKAATSSIPIVCAIASDPVEIGLAASLNRPGGNLTGITTLNTLVAAKRLELLHELLPAATAIGYLANPNNPIDTNGEIEELEVAARTLGLRLLILNATDESEFEAAFATLARERVGGLVIGAAGFFNPDPLIALAARHRVPAIYSTGYTAAFGGLMTYATDLADPQRLVGVYAGRILKGEKPSNLPVQRVTKMHLTINMKTAKALGITFPLTLLGRADEVIE